MGNGSWTLAISDENDRYERGTGIVGVELVAGSVHSGTRRLQRLLAGHGSVGRTTHQNELLLPGLTTHHTPTGARSAGNREPPLLVPHLESGLALQLSVSQEQNSSQSIPSLRSPY